MRFITIVELSRCTPGRAASFSSRSSWYAATSVAAWAAMLVAAYLILGRTGLGALLTAAFVVQVAPSIRTAYRTERPTGVSAGTWLLILGELACWLTFGLYKSDPRLITLGLTGATASALMLARIRRPQRAAAT